MAVKFYVCKHCGNVAVKVLDKGPTMVCCGDKMVELVPGSVDAAVEKHVPVAEVSGQEIKVKVGSVTHPMTDEHYITFIALETNEGVNVKFLDPEDDPEATFTLSPNERAVAVYEYCNLHGLWVKKF